MLKRVAAIVLVILSLSLQSCASVGAGLVSYVDSYDGYEFLYPNSWVPVTVTNGPDVVLHDLVEETENVSVIINPSPGEKQLTDLGTPTDVGYRLSKKAIAPPGSGRVAELVSAESREVGDQLYYLLEYVVTLPDQQVRHNLANVVIRRGQLFTMNLSTSERRWDKAKDLFYQVVKSFSVY